MSSLGVYAITLGGWSSNNKYALLGGLRSSAQMISYELAMGLSTIGVLLLAGSLSMVDIVHAQAQPLDLVGLTLPAGTCSRSRSAFVSVHDHRARRDRTARRSTCPRPRPSWSPGFHTEYSSMKFGLFFLGEFANVDHRSAAIAVTLFLGGWNGPWLPDSLKFLWFFAKLGVLLFFFIWVRWTFPRFRYDQLMNLGWKVLLPVSLAERDGHGRRWSCVEAHPMIPCRCSSASPPAARGVEPARRSCTRTR